MSWDLDVNAYDRTHRIKLEHTTTSCIIQELDKNQLETTVRHVTNPNRTSTLPWLALSPQHNNKL
jgi:hypothetical protein